MIERKITYRYMPDIVNALVHGSYRCSAFITNPRKASGVPSGVLRVLEHPLSSEKLLTGTGVPRADT